MKTVLAIVALLIAGCSNSGGVGSTSSEVQVTCTEPTNANTMDGGVGCDPSPPQQFCQVSSGATILPNGTVQNGTATCTNDCQPSEYSLICNSSSTMATAPDPSLNCKSVGGPQPANQGTYCCPCIE